MMRAAIVPVYALLQGAINISMFASLISKTSKFYASWGECSLPEIGGLYA